MAYLAVETLLLKLGISVLRLCISLGISRLAFDQSCTDDANPGALDCCDWANVASQRAAQMLGGVLWLIGAPGEDLSDPALGCRRGALTRKVVE